VSFTPRLTVSSFRAAIESAAEGHGVTRVLAYHAGPEIRRGDLQIVLADAEPEPLPINIISPYGRLSVPKVRAFVDFALPRLRARFACLAKDAEMGPEPSIKPPRGRVSAE
jgi:DNA-binding transcriptional LysR family regulator